MIEKLEYFKAQYKKIKAGYNKKSVDNFQSQLDFVLRKEKILNDKRESLLKAFEKLCSYDPQLFYEFKNSGKMIQSRMTHWSFQFESDSQSPIQSLMREKYNNIDDNLRLFTVIDTLKPNFNAGLRFTHELKYNTEDYDMWTESDDWSPIDKDYFYFILERMYKGKKITSPNRLKSSPKNKRDLKNTMFYKKYFAGKRGFADIIYKHFYEVDKLFKLNNSLPVYAHFNLTEDETNISFESTSRLFDGLRVDAKNQTSKEPVKLYFEHDSEMFLKFEQFVKTLISTVAPHFYAFCAKDLNANLFSHNRYYYKNMRRNLFSMPSFSQLRREVRNGHIDNKKIKNTYHASIDNLPFKVQGIVGNNKKTLRFPFEKLPIIYADKSINDTFIQHKSGHQSFSGELSNERLQVFTHKRVDKYKNDVDCIKHYNELDPSKFLDTIFDYDITNNKIHFKSRNKNPFSTPDRFDNTPEEILPRELSINKLVSIITDIYEAESDFLSDSVNRYDGRTVNSKGFLEERERFAVGGALASSISKIYEILYEDFINEYASTVISKRHVVRRDGYGRRVDRMTSKIVSSDNLSITQNKQYFDLNEIKNIFGDDIESIISTNSSKTRIMARVNNSLKEIKMPYMVQIDAVSPKVTGRVIGEPLYVVSLRETNNIGDVIHTLDFSMVGEGTRSIIASLIQIEVHRFFKRGPSFLTLREFENHLHPSLVGRFFRYLVKRTSNTNINLIIETHSEIVLRTLQSIVKNSNENINDAILEAKHVGIYYINKKRPGDTVIEKLILDKSGYFDTEKGSDLPPDFFDINSKLSRELQE